MQHQFCKCVKSAIRWQKGLRYFPSKQYYTVLFSRNSCLKSWRYVLGISFHPHYKLKQNRSFTNTGKSWIIETPFSRFVKRAAKLSLNRMWRHFSLDDAYTKISGVFCPAPVLEQIAPSWRHISTLIHARVVGSRVDVVTLRDQMLRVARFSRGFFTAMAESKERGLFCVLLRS